MENMLEQYVKKFFRIYKHKRTLATVVLTNKYKKATYVPFSSAISPLDFCILSRHDLNSKTDSCGTI